MVNSNPTTVIPGQPAGLNPESISPSNRMAPWIPGLRLTAHPGMTEMKIGQSYFPPLTSRTAS